MDKPTDPAIYMFGQQSIELVFQHIRQAFNNTRFNPPFSGDNGVYAQALYNRYPQPTATCKIPCNSRKLMDEETNTRRQIIGLIPKRWIFSWKILGAEDIRNSCQHQQQNTIAPRFGVVSKIEKLK